MKADKKTDFKPINRATSASATQRNAECHKPNTSSSASASIVSNVRDPRGRDGIEVSGAGAGLGRGGGSSDVCLVDSDSPEPPRVAKYIY